jgi:hypothetical protein
MGKTCGLYLVCKGGETLCIGSIVTAECPISGMSLSMSVSVSELG